MPLVYLDIKECNKCKRAQEIRTHACCLHRSHHIQCGAEGKIVTGILNTRYIPLIIYGNRKHLMYKVQETFYRPDFAARRKSRP